MAEDTCLIDGCNNPVDYEFPRDLCTKCHDIYFGAFYRYWPSYTRSSHHLKSLQYSAAQRECVHPLCPRLVDYKGARGFCTACYQRWKGWLKKQNLEKPPQRQNIDARYPSRSRLIEMMKTAGSIEQLANDVGVSGSSLSDYLSVRDDLRQELERYRISTRDQRWGKNRTSKRPSGNKWVKAKRASKSDRRRTTPITAEARKYVRVLRTLRCIYCNAPAGSVDHVIPLSNGGTWELDNLVPCCIWCNTTKMKRPLTVFLSATYDQRRKRRAAVAAADAAGVAFGYMVPLSVASRAPETDKNDTQTVIASPVFTSGQQLCLALLFADGNALDASGDANAGPRPKRAGRRRR